MREYLERYVYGPKSWTEFLDLHRHGCSCSTPPPRAGASTMTDAQRTRRRYTAAELLAVMSARQLKDGQVVFAGVGIPLLAATLAQRTALPRPDDPVRGRRHRRRSSSRASCRRPPTSSAAPRAPTWCCGSTDVLLLLQRGYVDVGFMGGAQIDQFGNLNRSFIGDPDEPEDAPAGHRRRQRHLEPHQR